MTEAHENSLAAFRALLADGSISDAKVTVAHALWQRPGGLTRNELDRLLSPGTINSRFSRRLTELERMGLIARRGARECSVSGNTCDVWVYAPHEVAATPQVPRMPTPDEARLLATPHVGDGDVCAAFADAMEVLRVWIAAGAPRCAEARRIPKGR